MTKMGTQFKADAFLKIGFKDRKSRVQWVSQQQTDRQRYMSPLQFCSELKVPQVKYPMADTWMKETALHQ